VSNRQRKLRRKQTAAAPRVPKAADEAKVVKVAADEPRPKEPADRDGYVWLARKRKWMTPALIGAGFHYRDLVRAASPGAVKSCIEGLGGAGGGQTLGLPFGGQFSDSAAQLELFVIRSFTFGNQADLVTVMDGVCGVGHTLRYLAGGDHHRAAELETALRIALDLLANARAEKLRPKKAA
jgi:hypothetical protein